MKRTTLLFLGVVVAAFISVISNARGIRLVFVWFPPEEEEHPVAPTRGEDPAAFSTGIQTGQLYSARACHLEPAWGTMGVVTNKSQSHNHSHSNICVGKSPLLPNTTATHLTCSDDKPTTRRIGHASSSSSSSSPSNSSEDTITIALLYFAKPALLMRQLQEFSTYPLEIQRKLTILIIDDGSPPGLQVSDYLHNASHYSTFRIRLARIVTERDWNIGGARNLAFYLIDTPKALLLDLDVLVPRAAMEAAVSWPLWGDDRTQPQPQSQQLAHRFNRRRADGSEHKHPAVCVIRTDAYWENGGCDEDFCGNYGFTDVHFWYRWKADDPSKVLVDHLDVFLEELDVAACDSTYIESSKEEVCKEARSKLGKPGRSLKKNLALYKAKTKDGCWSNKYLRFRWGLEY